MSTTPEQLLRAAENAGYKSGLRRKRASRISHLLLPCIIFLKDNTACVLQHISGKHAHILTPEEQNTKTIPLSTLESLQTGMILLLNPLSQPSGSRADRSEPNKWLWGTIQRFKSAYFHAGIGSFLINTLSLSVSIFIMNVYDSVIPNQAFETLWALAAGVLLALLFDFLARSLRTHLIDSTGRKIDLLLSSCLFYQSLSLRMNARSGSSGSFANELKDYETIREFISSATLTTIFDLPFSILFIAIIFFIGGQLAIIPAITISIALVLSLISQIPLARITKSYIHEVNSRQGMLVECLEGVETIKSLGAIETFQAHYEARSAYAARHAHRIKLLSSNMMNFIGTLSQIQTVLLVVFGVYLIVDQQLSIGALLACTILSGRAFQPISAVSALIIKLYHTITAYKTLNQIMSLPVDRPVKKNFLSLLQAKGKIDLENISFSYPDQKTPVLSQLSLSIQPGERVAILGKVGSGKSTLLKLLAGAYHPDSGNITLDGLDLQQIDPIDLQANVGYLPQSPHIFLGSIRSNLLLGPHMPDDKALIQALERSGLSALIARHPLGIDLPVGEAGSTLSGGQKQVLGLARMFLQSSKILLLDEPTNAVDSVTEQHLIHSIRDFSQQKTLILVTHKIELLSLVDRVIILDNGRVVADATPEQILKRSKSQTNPPSTS